MQTIFERKIHQLVDNLNHFDDFRNEKTTEIVSVSAPVLVRSQLASGKDFEGELIQSGYSAWWGGVRLQAGLQVDYVDLNFTGNFYSSIYLEEVDTDEYLFGSDVEYAPDLIASYNKILGVSETNLGVLRGIIKEKFLPQLKLYLNGRQD